MASRTRSGSSFTSMPASVTVPSVGRDSVASMRRSVVLPAPLGPNTERNAPSGSVNDTSSTALRPPNDFVR